MTQQPTQPHLTIIGTPSNLQEATTRANKHKRKTYVTQKIKVGLALTLALLLLTPGVANTQIPAWASLIYAALILTIETYASATKPTRRWVSARETAENIKRHTWLYAVRGAPYDKGDDADNAFKYHTYLIGLSKQEGMTRYPAMSCEVTPSTAAIRDSSFSRRQSIYLEHRARPMLNWYKARATHHKRLGLLWKTVLTLAQLTTITLLVGQLAGWWHVDLSSILGALIAAAASWSGMKQHPYLASIYKDTAANLENRMQGLKNADEKEWGTLVTGYENTLQEATKQWGAFRLGHN
jgi:hypothetical protein